MYCKRCLNELTFCEPIEHEARGGDIDHRFGCLDAILIVLAEPTIASEPSEAAFHDPGQAGDLEGTLTPFDNLQPPTLLLGQCAREFLALMPGIGDDGTVPQAGNSLGSCRHWQPVRSR